MTRHDADDLMRSGEVGAGPRVDPELSGAPVRETAHRQPWSELRQGSTGRRQAWGDGLIADLRYAARGLVRDPLFTGFAVVILALGVGANAAMFGLVDRLLLRGPAHVREPERVVRLYWTLQQPGGAATTTAAFDPRVYANLLAESRAFSGLAMQTGAWPSAVIGDGPNSRLVTASYGTANLLQVLGAQPAVGRFFVPEEQESVPTPAVVVLGFGLWHTQYAGDPAVVGRTVSIGGRAHTVVGVAPEGFTGAALERVDVWLPLSAPTGPAARHWGPGFSMGPAIIARLKPDVSLAEAAREATATYRRTYDGVETWLAGGRITAAPLRYGRDGTEAPEPRIARWLAGLALIVLLIACANLANLQLARTVRRSREFAVRRALGADRQRVMRLLLAGSMLLVLLGGLIGVVVASGISLVVRRVLLPDVDWTSGAVDGRVLLFSLAATLISGVAIGILPALRASRINMAVALKAGTREGGGQRAGVRLLLVATQAGLAMLLLVGAGLFVRSLDRVRRLALGVEPERVIVLSPQWLPPAAGLGDEDRAREEQRRREYVRRALDRLVALPVVEHAAAAVGAPFGNTYAIPLRVPGRDTLPRLTGGMQTPDVSAVTPDYFRTVGTRLVRGRLFEPSDRPDGAPVAVVSATMARVIWPGMDALGQCLMVGSSTACTRVVGVVEDARRASLREEPIMRYYLLLGQEAMLSNPDLLVRTRGKAEHAIPALRDELRRFDLSVLYVHAETMATRIAPQTRTWRAGALTFTLFAALALLVAAAGTFSVVAYVVEQRRHELGVRLALGSSRERVVGLVMRSTLVATTIGVLIGATVVLLGGQLAEPLLFETEAHDPSVLAIVAGMLLLAAGSASLVPALRARQVDLMGMLRKE